jgi:hypothetical protein
MNPETLVRGGGRAEAAAACGVVVVVHGGRSVSTEPTSAGQLSVLRMIPIGRAIGHAVHGSSVVVRRPRFRLRGWNGAQAVRGGDHAMLRRALLGHRIAAEVARAAFALPAGHESMANALTQAGAQSRRTVL